MPQGYEITSAAEMLQADPAHHGEHAATFDPWRWAEMREEESEALKHQMVSTSADYLAFGHGRHACPGRFFAVNELKAMMAYVVMNFDVKAEVEGVRPENVYRGMRPGPNPTAKVMFRKRVAV